MPQPDERETALLVIVVVRSGGVAGLSTRWRAEVDPARDPHWTELVDRCPWDAAPPPAPGPDRFQWRIEVQHGQTPVHRARLADAQVAGPWRALVDEVRETARPARGRPAPG